jgi:hypothetical protein
VHGSVSVPCVPKSGSACKRAACFPEMLKCCVSDVFLHKLLVSFPPPPLSPSFPSFLHAPRLSFHPFPFSQFRHFPCARLLRRCCNLRDALARASSDTRTIAWGPLVFTTHGAVLPDRRSAGQETPGFLLNLKTRYCRVRHCPALYPIVGQLYCYTGTVSLAKIGLSCLSFYVLFLRGSPLAVADRCFC